MDNRTTTLEHRKTLALISWFIDNSKLVKKLSRVTKYEFFNTTRAKTMYWEDTNKQVPQL